jgi:hypothetical protein
MANSRNLREIFVNSERNHEMTKRSDSARKDWIRSNHDFQRALIGKCEGCGRELRDGSTTCRRCA